MRRRLASFHSEMVCALGSDKQRIFFYSRQLLLSLLQSQHVPAATLYSEQFNIL